MEIKRLRTKPEPYVYSFAFTIDRKLTHDEIMSISHRAGEAMREIVMQATRMDTDAHNSSSGIENR